MQTFLEAAGVVFLAVVALFVLVAVIFVAGFLRRLLRESSAAVLAQLPDEIRLVRDDTADWPEPAEAERLVGELAAADFTAAGAFRIEPLGGQRTALFVGADQRLAAAVFAIPDVGTWVELWAIGASGDTWTYSPTTDPGLKAEPSWAHEVRKPGADLGELLVAWRAEPPREALALEPAELPRHVEADWKRRTAWRKQRGVSLGDFLRVGLRRRPAE